VAAHLEPEILMIDEVLSVGDLRFQKKSLGKMNQVAEEGRTVLFVSHQMAAVSNLCQRCLWLDRGTLRLDGPTDEVIPAYVRSGSSFEGSRRFADEPLATTDALEIVALRLTDADGEIAGSFDVREPFRIEIDYRVRQPMTHCRIGIFVKTLDGTILFDSYDSDDSRYMGSRVPGEFTSRCAVQGDFLRPGGYSLTVNADVTGVLRLTRLENCLGFEIYDGGAVGNEIGGRRRGVILPRLDWEVSAGALAPVDGGSER
ncbi:MAG: Wzt carbohydrate-binding domain-containing protein, partial [Acidobacteriota bacterium]